MSKTNVPAEKANPKAVNDASSRYSGTEQQEARNAGKQQGVPARKKPGVAGYDKDDAKDNDKH